MAASDIFNDYPKNPSGRPTWIWLRQVLAWRHRHGIGEAGDTAKLEAFKGEGRSPAQAGLMLGITDPE